ncbi:MAG: glycosyltransferase family 39 protein, partial [Candidatus Sumerlaeota bacterium]|nr:glycosyltransferase family 39 protein [Candidatus Sumerlaeota bacterium]
YSITRILPLFFILVLSSLGYGLFVLHLSGFIKLMSARLYILLFSGVAGILVLGDLFLLVGMLGLLQQGVLAAVLTMGIILGIITLHRISLPKPQPSRLSTNCQLSIVNYQLFNFLLISPFILLIFLHALIPDVSGDAYLYHLTVPNYYAQEGCIRRVPISFCYNYPLQIEMFYMTAIRFGQEQAGVMMSFALTLLTCVGLYLAGQKLAGRGAGLIAVFLFISMPLVMQWAPTSLVDLSTGTFLIAALLALLHWRDGWEQPWLLLAGICAGGAVAVKLLMGVAAFVIFPLAILTSLLTNKKSPLRRQSYGASATRNLICYGAGVFLPLLPWMIKNALLTLNPVYPFFLKLFPTHPDLIQSARILHNMHGLPIPDIMKQTWVRMEGIFPLLAWDAAWMPIIALVVIPALFAWSLLLKKERLPWGILFLMEVFLLYYGSNVQVRWFQGFYALFALAPAYIITNLAKKHKAATRLVMIAGMVFLFLIAGRNYYLRILESAEYPWTALSRQMLVPYILVQEKNSSGRFLNNSVPPNGRIFLYDIEILSTGRWLRRRFIQAGLFQFNWWERQNVAPEDILHEIKKMGVTHIAVTVPLKHPSLMLLLKRYFKKVPGGSACELYQLVEK